MKFNEKLYVEIGFLPQHYSKFSAILSLDVLTNGILTNDILINGILTNDILYKRILINGILTNCILINGILTKNNGVVEFWRIQIPTDRTSGTRTRATARIYLGVNQMFMLALMRKGV